MVEMSNFNYTLLAIQQNRCKKVTSADISFEKNDLSSSKPNKIDIDKIDIGKLNTVPARLKN